MDKPYLGILGIAMNIPSDEGTLNELTEQMRTLTDGDGSIFSTSWSSSN